MTTKRSIVLEGMLCGYKEAGKDSCQVTSWTLFHVHVEDVPPRFLVPKRQGLGELPSPPFAP